MARGEIHIQLSVNYDQDPKMRALARFGRDARACRDLYVQMVCYCKRNLTDGFVPSEEVGVLVYPDSPKTGKRDADRLVQVGLAESVDGGYRLPGFLKRNKSKAQVEAESAVKAAAGRKGGKRSGQVRRGEANTKQGASPNEAKPKQDASVCLNTETETETEVIGQRQSPPDPPHESGRWPTAGIPPSTGARSARGDGRDRNGRRAVPRPTPLGATLLADHTRACAVTPPRDVQRRTGEQIDRLLDEGVPPEHITAGLALMRARRGKGPGLLPDLVHEAMTAAASPNVTTLPGRPRPNVHLEHDAGSGIAEGF